MEHDIMPIREKRHRLPREFYRGEVAVSFTLCLKDRAHLFSEPQVIDVFTSMLSDAAAKANCQVPAYCFMPDHQHLMLRGTDPESDLWKTIVQYKQRTGYWLSLNRPSIEWQKDFHDHVIKSGEGRAVRIRYILDNPVRKGLAVRWEDYPFKGSIGCRLEDVLDSM